LRAAPYSLRGAALKTTIELLSSYSLKTVAELKQSKPLAQDGCQRIEGLETYNSYRCLQPACTFSTRVLAKVQAHILPTYRVRAKEHKLAPLWEECLLQIYVTTKGRIDYFVVANSKEDARVLRTTKDLVLLIQPEKKLFKKLKENYKAIKDDLEEQASVVQDFDSKLARVL
jgi:hypothetical protein